MDAPRRDDRPNLVVYGVGHSGTTILTKMLFALGWHAGEDAGAADEEFAENIAVRECNRHVLECQELPTHAKSVLARMRSPWAIKDPRFVLTLPYWQSAFAAELKELPTVVWLTRDLEAVKKSYVRRNEAAGFVPGGHGKTVEELWESADRNYQAWEGPKLQLSYESLDAAAALFLPSSRELGDRSISPREAARRLAQYARDNESLGRTILALREELQKTADDRKAMDGQLQQLQMTSAAYRSLLEQREEEIQREARRQIVRVAVSYSVPQDALLLVVSADEELMKLTGRQAWYFPQAPDGAHAGYHPASSADAIAHLEALRARGASFLLFPWESLWWLDHYVDFKQHLERQYQLAGPREDACVIYDLRSAGR